MTDYFNQHTQVNHSKEFVSRSCGVKTTTNTLEGVHGVIKIKARRMNLFLGSPSNSTSFQRKIQELVYRFNHRNIYSDDPFFVFLHLVAVYYPCCDDDDIEGRLSQFLLW